MLFSAKSKNTHKKKIAVVTMCYNERNILKIWLRHYTQQVGSENCYVLDHGSTDGSTTGLNANVIRLPRSPFDDRARAALVSDFCRVLLRDYEAVLYADADELVMAEPSLAINLNDYVTKAPDRRCVTVFGMDLLAYEFEDRPLDVDRSVLRQRRWIWPHETLCKPTYIREPYDFCAGFHLCHESPAFHGLYMFHLAYADTETMRWRQAKRNANPPTLGGAHHAYTPDVIIQHFRDMADHVGKREVALNHCAAMQEFIDGMEPYGSKRSREIWRLPPRFAV